jgi:methyl-accepting chemotaxis protein
MKRSIKRRIFTVNLFTITLLLVITALAFNLVARTYLERDTLKQLESVASRAESSMRTRKEFPFRMENDTQTKLMQSYIELFMSMRGPVSMLNAEYALIDNNNNLITPFENFDRKPTADELAIIQKILTISKNKGTDKFTLNDKGTQYAAVIKHIQLPDDTKAGTLLIYSSLDKINEMSRTINLILMIILVVSSFCVLLFSNYLSKGISDPLSKLNNHIRDLSELNFSNTLYVPADNEIQELVQNINKMAEKLDTHNKSQKLFLQNVSHEFRTPIMSIQSYAEGIQYGVVESKEAAQIIVDESKRLTHLVEEVLYLSRLDAIEEVYSKEVIDVNGLLKEPADFCPPLPRRNRFS